MLLACMRARLISVALLVVSALCEMFSPQLWAPLGGDGSSGVSSFASYVSLSALLWALLVCVQSSCPACGGDSVLKFDESSPLIWTFHAGVLISLGSCLLSCVVLALLGVAESCSPSLDADVVALLFVHSFGQ